ncbi:MAG: AMP-binding protein [Chloroflexota bacterium]
MTLKRMLEEVAGRYGDKAAIIQGNSRLSYTELDRASNKVANTLIKMGVNQGDRVAMLLSNSPEFVTTFFGITKIGASAAPLDIKYKADELVSIFEDCQPSVLVSESPTLGKLVPLLPKFGSVRHVIDLSSRTKQFLSYEEILATGSPDRITAEPKPEDIAVIAYTAGPSLSPKGVMLPHHNFVMQSRVSAEGFEQTAEDKALLFALPMHHAAGLTIVMLTSLGCASTVVMLPGLSMPGLTEVIEKERITVFIGVPFAFALAARSAAEEGIKHDLSSLRLCASGGAPLSLDTIEQFKQQFGRDLVNFWGLTEATAHVTCQAANGSGAPGAVGRPLHGWQLKVVDDNDRELPVNHSGELIVKGLIMDGYYRHPQATDEVIKDDWLHTGDIGKIDEKGEVYITGRKKDMVIIKGQNVFPGDIEDVLACHPKVAGVAALGIPDEMRGEVIGAVVKLKPGAAATEAEMKQFCLEHLAVYKIPKQVIFMDSLLETVTGKIDKEAIRSQLSLPPVFPRVTVP